jgi:chromosome segregation ATPase
MKIAKIQISNILGIERLECEPGKITTISGQNGSGKTSFLEAIKGVVGGGHDARLIRNGTDEGQIVLVFDSGETLTKKMNQKKSSVTFEDAEGKKMKLGATYLKDIIDPVGINPIQILTADPKSRVKMLLDSVPMELPADEIKFITGMEAESDGRHPLKVIEDQRKMIFDDRAMVNADVEKMETMVSEMRKSIPFKPDGTDWDAQVVALRAGFSEANEKKSKALSEIDEKFQSDKDKAKQEAQKKIDKLKDELDSQLDAIQVASFEKTKASITEFSPELESLTVKIAEAEVNAKNQASVKGAQDFVDKNLEEIEVQSAGSRAFTEQLTALDSLKAELLQNLPVKDLEVVDGDIFIGGVPFDTLNEAARIRFALMIAGLRKTKLPLVCVDGLEALDEGVFAVFKEEAEKTDMQFFVTRVSEQPELTLA